MNFKEALIAHLNGEDVEVTYKRDVKDVFIPFSEWHDSFSLKQVDDPDFARDCKYRIKPHTIVVNGAEVPAPEKEVPNHRNEVFVADPCNKDFYYPMTWYGIEGNYTALNRKLIYLNKEDAIARAKAMLIYKEV